MRIERASECLSVSGIYETHVLLEQLSCSNKYCLKFWKGVSKEMLLTHLAVCLMATGAIASKIAPAFRYKRRANVSHHPTENLHCPRKGLKRCKVNGTPKCVDIKTDPNHCGSCRGVCDPGATCENGVCTSAPPLGCPGGAGVCDNILFCGDGENCACYAGTSGSVVCVGGSACEGNECSVDVDCTAQAGGICALGTCCDEPTCSYPGGVCGNPRKRHLFAIPGTSSGRKNTLGT
jgi:hypothetical protein